MDLVSLARRLSLLAFQAMGKTKLNSKAVLRVLPGCTGMPGHSLGSLCRVRLPFSHYCRHAVDSSLPSAMGSRIAAILWMRVLAWLTSTALYPVSRAAGYSSEMTRHQDASLGVTKSRDPAGGSTAAWRRLWHPASSDGIHIPLSTGTMFFLGSS